MCKTALVVSQQAQGALFVSFLSFCTFSCLQWFCCQLLLADARWVASVCVSVTVARLLSCCFWSAVNLKGSHQDSRVVCEVGGRQLAVERKALTLWEATLSLPWALLPLKIIILFSVGIENTFFDLKGFFLTLILKERIFLWAPCHRAHCA